MTGTLSPSAVRPTPMQVEYTEGPSAWDLFWLEWVEPTYAQFWAPALVLLVALLIARMRRRR